MKISQIHSNIAFSNIRHNNKTAEFQTVPNYLPKKSDISAENYRANFLPRISFGKAQSPNYSNFYINNISFGRRSAKYVDTKEFSRYMSKRLDEDLLTKTESDIQNIVNYVCEKTDLDEKTILELVARLTQFSSYSQLPQLQTQIDKNGIQLPINNSSLSVNNLMLYLRKKNQIRFHSIEDENSKNFLWDKKTTKTMFLDDFILDYLENDAAYKNYLKAQKTHIFLLDGFAPIIDGKLRAYNMFSNAEPLQDVVLSLADEIKTTGKSIDEVLNGDIINRTKKIFGENQDITILKNDNANNPTAKSIAQMMKPRSLSPEHIQAAIETFALNKTVRAEGDFNKNKQRAARILSKYIDNIGAVYSSEKLSAIMKIKYRDIEEQVKKFGKTIDDVLYCIPTLGKSFDLMTYQYAKVNNIPLSQIITFNGEGYRNRYDYKNKVIVILDDIVGTCDSLLQDEFKYFAIRPEDAVNIIFSPIISLKQGQDKYSTTAISNDRQYRDSFMPSKVIDFFGFRKRLDPSEEKFLSDIRLFGALGYRTGGACTAMPYMTPDNNCEFSDYLLNAILNDPAGSKNKLSTEILDQIRKKETSILSQ